MSAEQNQSQTLFLRSEGILLVFLTAVAYAAFLLREMGYTNQFGLPHELINTSQVGPVSAAKAILFGVLGYTGKVNLVWLFTPRGDGFVATHIRKVIAVLLLIGFAMYPYCATDVEAVEKPVFERKSDKRVAQRRPAPFFIFMPFSRSTGKVSDVSWLGGLV